MRWTQFWLLATIGVSSIFPLSSSDPDHHPFAHIYNGLRVAATERKRLASVARDFETILDFVARNYDPFLGTTQDPAPWSQNVSHACVRDVGLVFEGARGQIPWALRFADAFGKPETGVLEGNLAWLGSFDQCMGIQTPANGSESFRGKYCLAMVGQPRNASVPYPGMGTTAGGLLVLSVGTCFPDSCSDDDTSRILDNVLTMVPRNLNVSLQAFGSICQPRSLEYDAKAIVAFCIIGAFGLLVTVGTLYDLILQRRRHSTTFVITTTPIMDDSTADTSPILAGAAVLENRAVVDGIHQRPPHLAEDEEPIFPAKEAYRTEVVAKRESVLESSRALADVLITFSVYSNFKKIFSTAQSSDSLACVHGIRFLSMTWVLLGHTYTYYFFPVRNISILPEIASDFWFQGVLNASVSVDTFFTMSGLLVSYLFLLNYQKTKKFPVLQYYIHRYWRLTAGYAVVMGLYLGLFKYLNSGPQWKPEGLEIDSCRTTWWTNFLYVNNLVRVEKGCMGWTWYLANDMQFYWISPLILLPLAKKPVIGLSIMGLFFAAHITATAIVTTQRKLQPSFFGIGDLATNGTNDFLYYYYIKPWTRIGPYLVGMLCGYLLVRYRSNKIRIPSYGVFTMWVAAAVSATAVLYGLWDTDSGHPLTPISNAVYNTMNRSAWALAVCWVIFACVNGYGGFVNNILSWKPLIPLSRLTYCCYLIHIPIILTFVLGRTTRSDFSHAQAVYYFFGNLTVTYGFAFLFTICCESPLLGMEKVLEKRISNFWIRKKS